MGFKTTLKHTESQLMPGFWFSPGFYAAYWDNHINKLFTTRQIIERVELKPHREVWVGSIFAAAQSLGGVQHFVGLPAQEPPDVEVIKFTETSTKKGTPGIQLSRIPLEVTRCNMATDETLIGQIRKKNKAAYTGYNLLVYEYGSTQTSNYETIYQTLKQEEEIFFDSIISVAKVDHTSSGIALAEGTFVVSSLYPRKGQTSLNISNSEAFFRYPEVVRPIGRATGTEWKNLGSFGLLAPKLKTTKH